MKYILDKNSGNKLSILGFGCMRFPKKIETEEMIISAVESGINYFDTAYLYHNSEEVLGEILEKNNLRNRVYIATKLPLIMVKSKDDFDKFFYRQLKRLKTNYIDYYLMHMITDLDHWEILCKLGIEDWIKSKKETGEIKNIGFSFHGNKNEFLKILDAYDWGFCQIQYNYSDPNYQAGVTGLKKAYEKGITVIIMEPLLGGKLVDGLPKKAQDIFKEVNGNYSPAGWGLRWLWNQEEVGVVLSGMSSMKQLKENIMVADKSTPYMLSKKEEDAFYKVMKVFNESYKIPCTGCGYCMPCPENINIPGCFSSYNMTYTMKYSVGLKSYMMSTGLMSRTYGSASKCIKCGKCEKHCPQKIKIRDELVNVKKRLEPFWYRFAAATARKILKKDKKEKKTIENFKNSQ